MEHCLTGLYTDYYELTMAQGYFLQGKKDYRAVFDLYFRTCPFGGGYAVAAGLAEAIARVQLFRFSADELAYLKQLGFHPEFLSYLNHFSFSGDIDACREGDIVFPDILLMRVAAPIIEAQLLESMLLNVINFQTLIATKTMRTVSAAQDRTIVDFGLRRAQGTVALGAARAAYIGGAEGPSNTLAAHRYGIPAVGTHAHSWIQSFDSEYAAFHAYASLYPDATTLLIDTYDTLVSGIPNAIRVAREMEASGNRLRAIRLDSGDLAYFSKKARAMLDAAGLSYVKIVVSNQLDEYLIASLLEQHAPIDTFGVGTKLICAYDQPALDGIYKLCEFDGQPTLKFSENPEKINNPGRKKVIRYVDDNNRFLIDGLLLEEENSQTLPLLRHPTISFKKTSIDAINPHSEEITVPVLRDGKPVYDFPSLAIIRNFARDRFAMLSDEHKRFNNPHVYRVGLSDRLFRLRHELIQRRPDHAR